MAKLSDFIRQSHLLKKIPRTTSGTTATDDLSASGKADDILSQDADAAQGDIPNQTTVATTQPTLRRLLPLTARIGFLGLAAVVMWWTWPRSSAPTFSLASDEIQSSQQDTATLAVVNPVNLETSSGEPVSTAIGESDDTPSPQPSQDTWFQSIVVVTPTSAKDAQRSSETDREETLSAEEQLSASTVQSVSPENEEIEKLLAQVSELAGRPTPVLIALEIPDASPSNERAIPALMARSAVDETSGGLPDIILVPTSTPTAQQVRASQDLLNLPKVEIVPALGVKFTPVPEQTTAPAPTEAPTPQPVFTVGPGRPWSTFAPLPPAQNDHFWIGNPFANYAVNKMASPNYQFGSTAGSRYRPHHGVDVSNPMGTPIQAAVAGEIVHAGLDDPDILGPYPNFYGKSVVIRLDRRLPVAGGELDVFLLYGHMSEVQVEVGQRIEPEDVVGRVGMTGIAIGPHLHIEIRLGANTYGHSVNPYLWMQPEAGNGSVAVRLLTADGRAWSGAKVSIARFENGRAVWARQIETYLDSENIGPDPAWGENGAMGDVPAGYYYFIGRVEGETLRAEFVVNAGQTSFVEVRTEQ